MTTESQNQVEEQVATEAVAPEPAVFQEPVGNESAPTDTEALPTEEAAPASTAETTEAVSAEVA